MGQLVKILFDSYHGPIDAVPSLDSAIDSVQNDPPDVAAVVERLKRLRTLGKWHEFVDTWDREQVLIAKSRFAHILRPDIDLWRRKHQAYDVLKRNLIGRLGTLRS